MTERTDAPQCRNFDSERAMIARVRSAHTDLTLGAGDKIHVCQLAERFLDRLELDDAAAPVSETAPLEGAAKILDQSADYWLNEQHLATPPYLTAAKDAERICRLDAKAIRALKNAAPQGLKAMETPASRERPAAAAPSAIGDTKRLDWLGEQGIKGMPWIARPSITGRGYRLHQSDGFQGHALKPTPREAIDAAMASADGGRKE